MLDLDKIDVFYGEVQVLRQVSLEINAGEVVSLLGSNGAGKTTTVNSISGVLPLAAGSITFMGEDISSTEPHERVEKGLIQIPEGRRIFPTLSVKENLEMGSFLKRPKALRRESMDLVMTLFPILRERTDQAGGTLSGGEQQMLAMARAILCRPRLLMLDEPSLGLAPKVAREVYDALLKISQAGTTILLVEQNAKMALGIANFGYIMETGRIVLEGTAKDLQENEDVQELYLGVGQESISPKGWRLYKKRRTW